jgi:hypothetical protein
LLTQHLDPVPPRQALPRVSDFLIKNVCLNSNVISLLPQ